MFTVHPALAMSATHRAFPTLTVFAALTTCPAFYYAPCPVSVVCVPRFWSLNVPVRSPCALLTGHDP